METLTRQTLVQLELDALREARAARQQHSPEALLAVPLLLLREVHTHYERLLVTVSDHGCVDAETFQAHADRLVRVRSLLEGHWRAQEGL